MSDFPSIPLSQLRDEQSAFIRSMPYDHAGMTRLRELGLITGTVVKLIRRAPLGDPLEISVRGTLLSLRHTEADHISVEPIDTTARP
jgi:ferrous iron transport protein A